MSAVRRTSLSNRRTRGPINKRACQRCRLGKIKCDGDAASNRSCSNCEPSACIFDTTPRKNKQIEQLKEKLDSVQQQIIDLGNNFQKKMAIKDKEMDLLCLLYESRNYFVGCEAHLIIFNALREAIKHGACAAGEYLDLTGALLSNFSSNENQAAEIIGSLGRIVNCVGPFQRDVSQLPDLLLQINNLKNKQDDDCHNHAELHHHHHHSSHQCNNILDHSHHQHYSDNAMIYNNDLPIQVVSSSIDQSSNMYNSLTNTVPDNSHGFIDQSFNQPQHNNNVNTANVDNSNYELAFFPYEIINNNGNFYAIPQQPAQSPPSPTTTSSSPTTSPSPPI